MEFISNYLEPVINYMHRLSTYDHTTIVIELFLIGIVVYWALSFLEGTRGERLFHGVIFILIVGSLVLNLLVARFGFDRLEYLYKGFLIAILIIAVSGFQPEIRRALMRVGQTPIISSSARNVSKVLDEIVKACGQMAGTRTGAIIVIERQIRLGEFIESGVKLDSAVTADLLKTIFYPGTPLHDMAVVIRGDKVIAARVQLPLAEAGALGRKELGSRHRAAVGISSGSDAICIVVSEETGIISMALAGKLVRDLDETGLRKSLVEVLGGKRMPKAFAAAKSENVKKQVMSKV